MSDLRKIAEKAQAINVATNKAVINARMPGNRLTVWLNILVIELLRACPT
jgi:hypothetical protein